MIENWGWRAIAAHIPGVNAPAPVAAKSDRRAAPADRHGTWSGYAYYKCRCEQCKAANKIYAAARQRGEPTPQEILTPRAEPEHGSKAQYARGCRCGECQAAGSKARVPLGVPSTVRRYRYRISPSAEVEAKLVRVFGGARWAHNAYIAAAREAHAAGLPFLTGYAGCKLIVTEGRANLDTAWIKELPSNTLRASVLQAADGYKAFFDSIAGRRKGPRMGAPRFKKRSHRQSAEFGSGGFSIRGGWETTRGSAGGRLRLAKVGHVAVDWHRPLPSAPSRVTIVREPDGTWWASFIVEVAKAPTTPVKVRTAAIDLGLSTYASIVYSDGTREKVDNPRFLRVAERKLAVTQKALSRKAKGSKNREKARAHVARAHARVANQRSNHARQLAARLIRENQAIVVESLNIRGMARSRLAKSISDAGWALFLGALQSGAEHKGREIIVAPPAFPSSRTCAICGVNSGKKALSIRDWVCACGVRLDRDWNAATNLLMLAARSAESQNACGRDVRLRLASASGAVAEEAGTHRSSSATASAAAL